jgi:HAMP domain-containing protein
MGRGWSLRRLVTVSLLLSFALATPFVGLVFYRLHALHAQAPRWAQHAEASRWLSIGAACQCLVTDAMAADDLERWRAAVARLLTGDRAWLGAGTLAPRLLALAVELDAVRAQAEGSWGAWVRSHCDEVRNVGAVALEHAVRAGLDPRSRGDRYEDLAVRDAATYVAVWSVLAAALLVWARRRVVQPIRRLERVMRRIADGDLGAEVPLVDGGELGRLAQVLRSAVERFERRDAQLRDKVTEMRELLRRMLDIVELPVLVVGAEHVVDYVNGAAAAAFAAEPTALQGQPLERLAGGEALGRLVDVLMREGEVRIEAVLEATGLNRKHVADCVVVRNTRGEATRVLIVLRAAAGGWWRQLWGA